MRLDLTELLQQVGKQEIYEVNEPPMVDEDIECSAPIEGKLTFTNAGGTLLIRGKAQTRVTLPCSRCIEYFDQPVTLMFDEQFELTHLSAGPRTLQTIAVVEEDESPVAGKLFEGHVFNLSEMLRQYILLDEPTQPLPPQRSDGRCAQCGLHPEQVLQAAEKTTGETTTEEAPVNPAFAKLGQLLQSDQ